MKIPRKDILEKLVSILLSNTSIDGIICIQGSHIFFVSSGRRQALTLNRNFFSISKIKIIARFAL